MSTNTLTATVRSFRELQAQIKVLEAEAETLKQAMIMVMDKAQTDSLTVGEYTIHYTVYQSSRLDTTALKKALPDIAAQYTKQTTVYINQKVQRV